MLAQWSSMLVSPSRPVQLRPTPPMAGDHRAYQQGARPHPLPLLEADPPAEGLAGRQLQDAGAGKRVGGDGPAGRDPLHLPLRT
eukprot:9487191-Pyramimonas_sp.AAC.2